jgi:hypothetical protein
VLQIKNGNMTQLEITARTWIEKVVAERGIKETKNLLHYNVTKNPYFRESNHWITAAWNRLNELNPS